MDTESPLYIYLNGRARGQTDESDAARCLLEAATDLLAACVEKATGGRQ